MHDGTSVGAASGAWRSAGESPARRLVSRRQLLAVLGGLAGAAVVGVSADPASSPRLPPAAAPPENVEVPAIAGSPVVGSILSATPGVWV